MRLARLFPCGAAALFALASAAHAQDHYGTPGSWMWTEGAWYGGAGFRAGSFKVPGFASGTTAANDTVRLFGHTFSRLTSYGVTGFFGYALTDGTLPPWLGRNARLQLFGGYNDGQAVTSVAPGPVATNFSSVSVDGLQVATDTDTATITSVARVHQRDWQTGFRFATDYEFAQGTFIVTPTFDVIGGQAYRTYRLFEDFGLIPTSHTVTARLRSTDIGGTVGAIFSWKASPAWVFHAGGHVTLAHRRVSLDASDCFGGTRTVCHGTVFATTAADTRTALAVLPGGEIGATYSANGFFLIGVTLGLEHDNRSPGIRLPALGDRAPASIVFANSLNYWVQVKATVKLY